MRTAILLGLLAGCPKGSDSDTDPGTDAGSDVDTGSDSDTDGDTATLGVLFEADFEDMSPGAFTAPAGWSTSGGGAVEIRAWTEPNESYGNYFRWASDSTQAAYELTIDLDVSASSGVTYTLAAVIATVEQEGVTPADCVLALVAADNDVATIAAAENVVGEQTASWTATSSDAGAALALAYDCVIPQPSNPAGPLPQGRSALDDVVVEAAL